MTDTIWISWQQHLRTSEICKALEVELHTLLTAERGWRRYADLLARTFRLIRTRQPATLIVQNPSIILTSAAVLWRPFFRYRLVVDAHNEAVNPHNYPSRPIRALARWLLRCADLTVVTNRYLADNVRHARGNPFVLPDRIPTPPVCNTRPLSEKFNLVLIATFASDEPYREVFSAVAALGERLTLYVTGNPQKVPSAIRATLPAHIVLTGFLSEPDYWTLLASARAVIDLTQMDNCLVCGAYEAVALERPLVLSDNRASREHFSQGTIYTLNTVGAIRHAVDTLMASYDQLARDIKSLKPSLQQGWERQAADLLTAIQQLHRPTH